jgi:hypothetical protein
VDLPEPDGPDKMITLGVEPVIATLRFAPVRAISRYPP